MDEVERVLEDIFQHNKFSPAVSKCYFEW
jgi:hypothetical protein